MFSIELGALMGAMLMTLIFAIAASEDSSDDSGVVIFGVAPVLGALWGAVVAAVIHFTASGTLPLILMGLITAAFN